MWNWPNRLCMGANVALCLIVGFFILRHGVDAPQSNWSYSDLVSVLLTAVTVVLAALGLGIAVLAVWGYQKITDHAVETSVAAVNKRLNQMLEDQNLKQTINDMLQPHLQQAADQVWQDNFAAAAYPPEGGNDDAR